MNVQFALEILLRAALWGTVALGGAWILCFAARNHLSAGVRVWIWRVALAKMILGLAPLSPLALTLLPPVEPAPQSQKAIVVAPMRKIAPLPKFSAPVENLEIAPATSDATVSTAPLQPLQREIPQVQSAAPPPISPPFRPDWPLIALMVWAFGALVQAIQLTRGYSVARGLRRDASPLENELVSSITAQCCARLAVRHAPQLAISTAGPLLLGTIRPLILLPEPIWRTWNEVELRLVLAHEVAHHKRADLRWNFLLGAAQILFWFHPLLWIAQREWRACCEQACDELTLRGARESAALYGALLLRLATQSASNGPAMVGVSEFALLKGRLMELKFSNGRRYWPRWVVALAMVAGAASLLPWQLTARAQVEAPQLDGPMLKGILRDARGRIIADADVFALGWRYQKPFLHTDRNGYYQLSGPSLVIPDTDLLYVRGKKAGFARFDVVSVKGKLGFGALKWLPTSVPKVAFVDENNRPVKDWEMRVWSVGKPSHLRRLPPFLSQRFSARTDARGEISFPALPQGLTMQLESGDTDWVDTYYGLPNRRGVRFAPLIKADWVALQGAETRRTIRLLKPATLSGQVTADGGAPGVPIMASLLEAGEAADQSIRNKKRHRLIASMLTDAKGRYQMKGLRPGRYSLYIFPKDDLQPRYTGQFREFVLHSGPNTANLQFTTGARIQGRVVSAKTGRPVAGQTLGLVAPEFSPQYVISRADGTFDFHIAAGKQHFWVAANGTNSPPPGYILPAQNKFDFSLKEGQTKTFLIQLPGAAMQKPITGRVLGPDGVPVAGANVEARGLSSDVFDLSTFQTRSDKNGKFIVRAARAAKPLRLFADSGPLQTARGTVAVAGDDVTLKVEAGVGVTFAGRVEDVRTRASLSGVRINLTRYTENRGHRAGTTTSDNSGYFEFSNLRPHENYALSAELPNYAHFSEFNSDLMGIGTGERREVKISLRGLGPANSFAKGRVFNFDGTPAVGLPVRAEDANPTAYTDKLGNFTLRGIPAGPIALFVFQKGSGGVKTVVLTLTTKAGTEPRRSNLVIRLERPQNRRQVNAAFVAIQRNGPQIGQIAPPIRAAQWFNSAPLTMASLRGQVVLLDIKWSPLGFWSGAQPEVEEIGRAFAPRGLRVIGIQDEFGVEGQSKRAVRVAATIRQIGLSYPIALGAVSANPLVLRSKSYPIGATTRAYGMKPRVVIDRAGRIAYIGDSLSDAVSVAAGLLAAK